MLEETEEETNVRKNLRKKKQMFNVTYLLETLSYFNDETSITLWRF